MKRPQSKICLKELKDLEARASAKTAEYSAAVLEGKPADDLLQAEIKLRNEAEALRRAAIEAEKQEAGELEKEGK